MDGRAARTGPIKSFRDLDVYVVAQSLMADVHRIVLTLPEHEKFGLVDQMRRASKSVGALIAEGWGLRQSEKEFKNFLRRSLGSANEMEAHLDTARSLGYGDQTPIERLLREYALLGGKLVRSIANWHNFKAPSSTVHPPSSARSTRNA